MKTLRLLFASLVALPLAGCVSETLKMIDEAMINVKIGVLADTQVGWREQTRMLRRAFEYYRQEGVDAVVIAGAVTKSGVKDQFDVLDKVWQDVFGMNAQVRLIIDEGRQSVKGFDFAVASDRPLGRQDVLTFYGTRRLALTDELCFYPRRNLAICAGSMSGLDLPQGYQDAELGKHLAASAQGLLVLAYGGKTVVRRLDFTQTKPISDERIFRMTKDPPLYAEEVAPAWVVDSSASAEREDVAPEFWPDTQVRVITGYSGAEPIYTVKWPSALSRISGERARWYELSLAFADRPENAFRTQTVLSYGYHQSEARDTKGAKWVFKTSDLPKADDEHSQVVFTVVPIGSFGKRGKAVSSQPVPLRR